MKLLPLDKETLEKVTQETRTMRKDVFIPASRLGVWDTRRELYEARVRDIKTMAAKRAARVTEIAQGKSNNFKPKAKANNFKRAA